MRGRSQENTTNTRDREKRAHLRCKTLLKDVVKSFTVKSVSLVCTLVVPNSVEAADSCYMLNAEKVTNTFVLSVGQAITHAVTRVSIMATL